MTIDKYIIETAKVNRKDLEKLEQVLIEIDSTNQLNEDNYLKAWNQLETHFQLKEKLTKRESKAKEFFKKFRNTLELKYNDFTKVKIYFCNVVLNEISERYLNEITDSIANQNLITNDNEITYLKNIKNLMQLKGFDISNYQPIIDLWELNGVKINSNQLTGFTCNLHPDTVKEIFNLMVNK